MSFTRVKNEKELKNLLDSVVKGRKKQKELIESEGSTLLQQQELYKKQAKPVIKELNDLERLLKDIKGNTSTVQDKNIQKQEDVPDLGDAVFISEMKKFVKDLGLDLTNPSDVEYLIDEFKNDKVMTKEEKKKHIKVIKQLAKEKQGKTKTPKNVISNMSAQDIEDKIRDLFKQNNFNIADLNDVDAFKMSIQKDNNLSPDDKKILEEVVDKMHNDISSSNIGIPLPSFNVLKSNINDLAKETDYDVVKGTKVDYIVSIPIKSPVDGYLTLYIKNKQDLTTELIDSSGNKVSKSTKFITGIKSDGFWASLLLPYINTSNPQLQLKDMNVSEIVSNGNNTLAKIKELYNSYPTLELKDDVKQEKVMDVLLNLSEKVAKTMNTVGFSVNHLPVKCVKGGRIDGTHSVLDMNALNDLNKLIIDNNLISQVSDNVKKFILGKINDINDLDEDEKRFLKELSQIIGELMVSQIKKSSKKQGKGPVRTAPKSHKKTKTVSSRTRREPRYASHLEGKTKKGKGPAIEPKVRDARRYRAPLKRGKSIKVYSLDELPERLELLANSIVSGNNSMEIKEEAIAILDKLRSMEEISNTQYLNGIKMFS